MGLRQSHELEKEELHNEYHNLKAEATRVVSWLRKELSEQEREFSQSQSQSQAQSQSDSPSISPSQMQFFTNDIEQDIEENSDLESLTKSEKGHLLRELKEEREKWQEHFADEMKLASSNEDQDEDGKEDDEDGKEDDDDDEDQDGEEAGA